ncbi:MAG: MBL fold metallo-hydrolase [Candidatus Giovannonibacteria bacterium]|nr:MAG: MBL fold metallo-hydrolase [Candidatus Giovannonibacteria bacterium]
MTRLSFYGAAQEVTGSCFLLESESAGRRTKILVDCGLFQCPKFCDIRSREPFPFGPESIDALFVTHAHIDHTGRIPKLIKDGFRGKIFSSHATKELAELMLKDSVGVLEKEARREGEGPLYSEADVDKAASLWEAKETHEEIKIGGFSAALYDAGHILGSAMAVFDSGGERILFSGDIGNAESILQRSAEVVKKPTCLIMESTYGDRAHESAERVLMLERVIERTVKQGGVLMIPAFALERTQELLSVISKMMGEKQIPKIPVYLDSPLSIKATSIYEKYLKIPFFKFPGVNFSLTTEESKKINGVPPPKIIIAGSGMSTGGRILHHERRYLPDERSTLLIVSYQAPGSLGRRIEDGAKSVEIFGEEIPVRCRVEVISGYSAHADRDALFEFVRAHSDTLKKVYAVHGEPKSSLALVQKIRDNLGIPAYAPKYGESVEI